MPTTHPCLATSAGRSSLVPSKYSMTVMIFVVMLSFYYFSRHVSDSLPSTSGSSLPLCVFTLSPCPYFLQAPRQQDLSPAVNSISGSSPRKPTQGLSRTTSVQRTPSSRPYG